MSVFTSVCPPRLPPSSSIIDGASIPRFGEPTDLVGELPLPFILALAICKMSARLELRSPAVPDPSSDHKDDPDTLDPEISDPSSHVPALGSSPPIGVATASEPSSGGSARCCFVALQKVKQIVGQPQFRSDESALKPPFDTYCCSILLLRFFRNNS